MKARLLAGLVGSTLAVVGCASSAEIQNNAYEHQQMAQYYQSHGDYVRAADEQRAANKQYAKARQRAYDEAYYPRYYW